MLVFELNNKLYLIPTEHEDGIIEIYDGTLGKIDRFYLCEDSTSIYCLLVVSGSNIHFIINPEELIVYDEWTTYEMGEFVHFTFICDEHPGLHFLHSNLTITLIEIVKEIRYIKVKVHIEEFGNNDPLLTFPIQAINEKDSKRLDIKVDTGTEEIIYSILRDNNEYYVRRLDYDNLIGSNSLSILTLTKNGDLRSIHYYSSIIASNVENFFTLPSQSIAYFVQEDRLFKFNVEKESSIVEVLPGNASYIRLPFQSHLGSYLPKNSKVKSARN